MIGRHEIIANNAKLYVVRDCDDEDGCVVIENFFGSHDEPRQVIDIP